MTVPTIVVRPDFAAQAYADTARGLAAAGTDAGAGGAAGTDFGATLQRALGGVVASGQAADAQAMQAVAGGADLTQVVGAVSKAELALQTTLAIRDRVVQAYQDIMKMPI